MLQQDIWCSLSTYKVKTACIPGVALYSTLALLNPSNIWRMTSTSLNDGGIIQKQAESHYCASKMPGNTFSQCSTAVKMLCLMPIALCLSVVESLHSLMLSATYLPTIMHIELCITSPKM